MRKFLLVVLMLLIFVLAFFFVRDGIELGSFKVLGVYDIQSHNEQLDEKIAEAKDVTSIQINSENDKLKTALEDADKQKEKYEKIVAQTDPKDIEEALKKEQYEIEKLWISVGNYADKYSVVVNMKITTGTSGIAGVKDLNFTVNGSYTNITNFIYDLEEDNELEFKISDFSMLPDKEKSNLKATFSVKDLYINIDNSSNVTTTNSVNDTNSVSEISATQDSAAVSENG